MAAVRTGKRIAVVTRMAKSDEHILGPMKEAGIDTYLIETPQTTYMNVIHPTADVDVRQMFQRKSAGHFTIKDMPAGLKTRALHLAGITDREFTLEFMHDLKAAGYHISTDMQSFVRQVNLRTREIAFADVADKQPIAALMEKLKLDIVEAEILTGTDDLEQAAKTVEGWGCPEIMITRSEGVLARVNGKTYYEKFSNKNVSGRTGRGDTTFAAYLCARMDHDVAYSLKFAAALVSIKMETPGPFAGTHQQVLERMRQSHGG
jgi:sugar/nucleoside kinase (ribokinase family)